MDRLRIGISTQTPLLRFTERHDPPPQSGPGRTAFTPRPSHGHGSQSSQGAGLVTPTRLSDYSISPGGVSRMVLESIRAWQHRGWIRAAHWFSLQPRGPPVLRLEDADITLHHLKLPSDQLGAYARTKEKLWADIHGVQSPRFDMEDFRFYARYNGHASDAILEQTPDIDIAYVHDFQLLQVGALVGLAAPCVLRWHVPFDPQRIPKYTRNFLLRMMEAYDGVIVSTRRDLEGLTNAGFRGKVRQLYPHSDAAAWAKPGPGVVQDFEDYTGFTPDVPVVLCVARMDPIKRQDLVIQAFAKVRRKHPTARLVLVGNGSFSASAAGGLGLSKADRWRAKLETTAHEAGVADAVLFTGWLPDEMVAAAYERASALVLASDIEGFGLTPFEAWGHGKPCVLSSGCGASEVVQHGVTGLVFPSGDVEALAQALDDVLSGGEAAARMGEAGRIALQTHRPEIAADHESAFMEEAMQRFRRQT